MCQEKMAKTGAYLAEVERKPISFTYGMIGYRSGIARNNEA